MRRAEDPSQQPDGKKTASDRKSCAVVCQCLQLHNFRFEITVSLGSLRARLKPKLEMTREK